MINLDAFLEELTANDVDFFTGVPDSLLNGFCSAVCSKVPAEQQIMAANEGNAVAIACGHYFATKKIPLVYMQNSGIGNAMNPLISLADENVYSVPMVLLIGWRGEPSTNDWAQHKTQGEITLSLLDSMNIPHFILDDDDETAKKCVVDAVDTAKKTCCPVAIVAKKGALDGIKLKLNDSSFPLSRENAIEVALNTLPKDTVFIATTGRATRELFALRQERGETHENDFLNVGSMGHASSVALGMALANQNRLFVCLDGDAAAIMHMGAISIIGKSGVKNVIHLILNNGANESVGGQPSAGRNTDFSSVSRACGYHSPQYDVSTEQLLKKALEEAVAMQKPCLIDVKIHMGMRGNLPPLRFEHSQYIKDFMKGLDK